MEEHDHPLYKRMGSLAERMGGHGGMDFLMRYRMIDCLRNGEPLDQNLYEGCFLECSDAVVRSFPSKSTVPLKSSLTSPEANGVKRIRWASSRKLY